jgi:hypothetical protein
MELLLNIVWLVVALGLGVGLSLHQRVRIHKPSTFLVAVAITCIIFVLFPAISLTDDLHPVTYATEDSARRFVSIALLVQCLAVLVAALFALVHFGVPLRTLPLWVLRETPPQQRALDGYFSPLAGRAPPVPFHQA